MSEVGNVLVGKCLDVSKSFGRKVSDVSKRESREKYQEDKIFSKDILGREMS